MLISPRSSPNPNPMFDRNLHKQNPLVAYLSLSDFCWDGVAMTVNSQINAFGVLDGITISYTTDAAEYQIGALPIVQGDEVLIAVVARRGAIALGSVTVLPYDCTRQNFKRIIALKLRKIKRDYILQSYKKAEDKVGTKTEL